MWWSGGSADCIRSGDSGRSRHPSRLASRAPRDARKVWRAHLADSDFKQPCAIARALWSAPGRPSSRIPNLGSLKGSGAPADAGACETPGGWPARPSVGRFAKASPRSFRNEAPPGAPRRRSATDGPRFRERGPATPVSQLLAPGPIARERSPAIARALRSTFLRSPRHRIDRWRGFPGHRPGEAWPNLRPVSHRRSVFTASHDDAPLEEQDDRTIGI